MSTLTRREAIVAAAALGSALTAGVEASHAQESAPSPLKQIRATDYTILYARNIDAMRRFYEDIMMFEFRQAAGDGWIEFKIGSNILVLTAVPAGGLFPEAMPAEGVGSVQLAFRVPPKSVDACADALRAAGVTISGEPTDQPWGHRTLFFRDPDNNILEIYADI